MLKDTRDFKHYQKYHSKPNLFFLFFGGGGLNKCVHFILYRYCNEKPLYTDIQDNFVKSFLFVQLRKLFMKINDLCDVINSQGDNNKLLKLIKTVSSSIFTVSTM